MSDNGTYPPNVIEDGYTEDFFIDGEPGLHGPLRGKKRPMLPEERDSVEDAVKRKGGGEASRLFSSAMQKHVIEWSDGDLTLARISKLRPRLHDKLWNNIAGWRPNDELPQSSSRDEQREYAESLLESAATGQPIGQVQAEAASKN